MPKATPDHVNNEMESVTSADGTEITFERTGSGPPLVLVHGGGGIDHRRWELFGAVRPALAEHFTVYAMDRRGRGESGDADEYAIEREFEDVATVVDAIDEPGNLFGHSDGALLALEAALRTDNLHTLILYEHWFEVGDHKLDFDDEIADLEALIDAGENEQALVLTLREMAGLTPEKFEQFRTAPIWQGMVDAAHTIPREARATTGYEFDPARFADMTTPTLVMVGGESPQILKDVAEATADALPNSRVVTFEGHGHRAMDTATDRFIDELLAFIGETD